MVNFEYAFWTDQGVEDRVALIPRDFADWVTDLLEDHSRLVTMVVPHA